LTSPQTHINQGLFLQAVKECRNFPIFGVLKTQFPLNVIKKFGGKFVGMHKLGFFLSSFSTIDE
jgi:hypothetical protein